MPGLSLRKYCTDHPGAVRCCALWRCAVCSVVLVAVVQCTAWWPGAVATQAAYQTNTALNYHTLKAWQCLPAFLRRIAPVIGRGAVRCIRHDTLVLGAGW